MKKIYSIILVFICFSLHSQIINFPDANFKLKLLSSNTTNSIAIDSNNNNIKIDANNNGEIEISEALQVYKLFYTSNSNGEIPFKNTTATSNPITNLTGISYFSNLRYLNVNVNELTTIDLSNNVLLEQLYCYSNQINTLNLNNLNNLSILNIRENNLNSLDTTIFPQLTYLDCSHNNFSSLNLSANSNLNTLFCSHNNLQNLDVINNLLLIRLNCNDNQISSLTLNNLSDLQYLNFSQNLISYFNFANFNNLKTITCASNQLNSLVFNNNSQLIYLYCPSNNLTDLDVSQTSLKYLDCSINSNLTFINIKNAVLTPQYNDSNPIGPPNFPSFNFNGLTSLNYLCFDDGEQTAIQTGFSGTIPSNVQLSTTCTLITNNNLISTDLIISPNPAYNFLTIYLKNYEIFEISIYNSLGQLVKELKHNITTIDVSNLKKGTYFITVTSENSIETQKFIKI